jgi:hypothetical protein
VKRLLLILLALPLLVGCKVTEIRSPGGWSFKRSSFAYADSIGLLRVPIGTNYVEMQQFKSDADRAIGLAEKAVGLAQKATPVP